MMIGRAFLGGSLAVWLCLFALVSGAVALPAGVTLTRDNWTELAAFPVDTSVARFETGVYVTAKDLEKLGGVVAPCIRTLMENYALGLRLTPYRPVVPSDGYIEATNRDHRDVRIEETDPRTRGLSGYVAGLPFPRPESGLEVAWDFQYRYMGDDALSDFAVYWISASRGIERREVWTSRALRRAMHRTDLDPMPNLPGMQRKGIEAAWLISTDFPASREGMVGLHFRYERPIDLEAHIYVPTLAKQVRIAYGIQGESFRRTDLLFEDAQGYAGHPEWMRWRILEKKTFLAPMHADVALAPDQAVETFDFKTWPHWNPDLKWEPRPVYVLEARPRVNGYPYSRMVLYVDAESFQILFKEGYDREGHLWKIMLQAFNGSPAPSRLPPELACTLLVDVLNEHATAFASFGVKANQGLGEEAFDVKRLRGK